MPVGRPARALQGQLYGVDRGQRKGGVLAGRIDVGEPGEALLFRPRLLVPDAAPGLAPRNKPKSAEDGLPRAGDTALRTPYCRGEWNILQVHQVTRESRPGG